MPSYLHSTLPCASFGLGQYRHIKRATAHTVHDCEHGLVQTRKYFTRSLLKTARLHEIQAADVDFRFIFVIIQYSPVLFNSFASGAADIGDQLVFRYSRPVFKLSGEINWID